MPLETNTCAFAGQQAMKQVHTARRYITAILGGAAQCRRILNKRHSGDLDLLPAGDSPE